MNNAMRESVEMKNGVTERRGRTPPCAGMKNAIGPCSTWVLSPSIPVTPPV